MNLATIIDTPLWYKIWQLSGHNPTRVKQETSQKTKKKSLQKFLEPTRKPRVIYTDNSLESGKCCEDLSWNHCTSTPHRSETNGIPKRAVRRIKEGTSAVLWQSGLHEKWWADPMECHCYLRNIRDLLSDGKTPYERPFGMPFNKPGDTVWSDGRISPQLMFSTYRTTSIWSKSLARKIPWICVAREENLFVADIEC